MRKIIVIVTLSLLAIVFVSCKSKSVNGNEVSKKNATKSDDIREVAYQQLTYEEKKIVKGGWEEAKISKMKLEKDMGVILDESYIGKEVYVVDFATTRPGIPDNLPVFISIDNEKLIGCGFIE